MLTSFLYILSTAGMAVIGLLVFLRNLGKSSTYFSVMTFAASGWLALQFAATRYPQISYQLVVFGLLVFSLIPISCLLFSATFAELDKKTSRKINIFSAIILLQLLFLGILPDTVHSVEVVNGGLVIETGVTYTIQTLMVIGVIALSVAVFVVNYKRFPSSKRVVTNYIMTGLFIAVMGNLLSGLVFSSIAGVQFIGPLSIFVMVALVAYAITRHGLFDIRLVIARSLGYLLSTGLLAVIYGILTFSVVDTFLLNEGTTRTAQQTVYTILAVTLALTLQPMKRFFDKLTNRLFYRDAYDSQDLLDNINKVLISTADLDQLLRRVSTIIADTLKVESVYIGAEGKDGPESYRLIGSEDRDFSKRDIEFAQSILMKTSGKIVITDQIESSNQRLKKVLLDNDVAVVIKFTELPSSELDDRGYIIVGNKKSGSPFSGQDIKVLTIIADGLILAIQNALRFEEIQNFSKTLEKKVDDATRRLRKANDKLVALDHTKDDFISMASHQLRTPLTSVKGYISMVLEGDAGKVSKEQRELLGQAFASSQRMVYLIADLLNVSRLKTGKFVIDSKEVNLADVVEGEVAQLKETAAARGLKLMYKKPKDFPALMLDETKIRQVLTNYMDNAIYYTPKGGRINVELKNGRRDIEFTVTDNGIGIPKHEQHNLFTKFYRAGNAKKARPDGTGLGLFMAKKVVIAQGGAIIFTSTEGKGSTFGFIFDKSKLKVK